MGTITRSGRQMGEKMTRFIPHDISTYIVEFGAGDGAITDHIIKQMSESSTLLVFEINPDMFSMLQKKFNTDYPKVILINDGAQNLECHLNRLNIDKVDQIISGLPLLILPEDLRRDILSISKKHLKSEGYFVQMHYTLQLKYLYQFFFKKVEINFVPFNIPPGYVLKCTNY